MLSPEGFLVESSSSGEQALASVAEQPPDLILLDVMMPGMDGYDVASRLKADLRTKNIPIVMLTAHDDRNAKMLGLRAGAEDFLTKPVDRAELCVRVRNLLRLKAYGDAQGKYSQLLESEVSSRTADLVESERLYRSTFDAAPVGIVHVGLNGQWLRVNQRLCDMLGYSRGAPEQRLRAHACEIRPSKRLVRQMRRRHAGSPRDEETLPAERQASSSPVELSVHRDAAGRPQHFISVVEDITERRTLEAQVRQASKMEAIGLLASGVAHDFNNILSVVLSYSELLAADLKDGDPMRADLEEIRGAGLHCAVNASFWHSAASVLEPQIVA